MKVKSNKKASVKPTAPVAKATEPKAEPKVEAKAKAEVVKVSKYKGATTGLRVMEYQDQTFAANAKAMRTDEELAAMWRKEFPNAVAFEAFHVKGARRDFNAGTHSKMYASQKPATPLHEVIVGADGRRSFAAGVTAATPKVKAKVEAKAPAAPAAPAPAAKAKATRPKSKAA